MNIQQNFSTATTVTAQKLHQEFVRLGGLRFKLKNRMLAILPQIYESGIYKKYAGSIVEYAGKFGDIAKTTVIKRLRLEENLDSLPCLKAAIEKVGVHKVAMVAKIATPETDEALADNVLNMSKMAVQSLSKELRAGQREANVNKDQQIVLGDFDSDFVDQNQFRPCRAVAIIKKIDLDESSTFLFLKLKAKLGKNLSDKEFLKIILEEREKQEFPQKQSKIINQKVLQKQAGIISETINKNSGKISDQKSITGDSFSKKHATTAAKDTPAKNVTGDTLIKSTVADWSSVGRYIRADKKRQVVQQTNGKCAYPNCNAPYEILHHKNRYSESKNHDSVIPLCKIHHEFAHNNLIQNEMRPSNEWRISVKKIPAIEISQADILYRKYRHNALT